MKRFSSVLAFLLMVMVRMAVSQVPVNGVYSIIGNGSTDNTAAIQAAVTACGSGSTCTIQLTGSVVVAGTVTLPTTTNLNFVGTGLVSCTGSGVNCFQRTLSSGYESHRVTFSGLTLTKANTGAVLADLQIFNSNSNQGMTITGNYFTLSGSAVGWLVQGSSGNAYTNNMCTSPEPGAADVTGTCIQIQNSTNAPGPQLSTVTANYFYFLNAITTILNGTGDSWEGWQFQGNQYNVGLISIANGTEVTFVNEEFSGTNFTVRGGLNDLAILNSYFDESSNGVPGSSELTVSDAAGSIASLRIEGNQFEQLDGNNQSAIHFTGSGSGFTGVTLNGNTYSAVSPGNITAISATTTVLTVTVPNNYASGQTIGLQNLSPQVVPNGTVATVTSATSSQFTAAYSSAGFASTSVTGLAYPVAYGIWLDNPADRNFMISNENFRLEWTPIHITNTLAYSTIGVFNQRDTGGPGIDGLSYLTSTDSLFYSVGNGNYVVGGITDCSKSFCAPNGVSSATGFYGSGTTTVLDGEGSGGIVMQYEQSPICTMTGTFQCTGSIGGATILSSASRGNTFTCTSGGTIAVANVNVDTGSDITITLGSAIGTISTPPAMKTITSGTGFTMLCALNDASVYRYRIWN